MNSTHLIIVDDTPADKVRGGVQLLAGRLLDAARARQITAEICTTMEVSAAIDRRRHATTIVFAQRSGELSASFMTLASRWISQGAIVFEENIFARPSRFRLNRSEYVHVLMSMDGLHRFRIRSMVFPFRSPGRALILPNPVLFTPKVRDRKPQDVRSEPITFLRLGRPDKIKWSEFESDFCKSFAAKTGLHTELRRVGYPGPARSWQEGKVTIHDIPYSDDPSGLYATSDAYIHFSRIGESFGNTVAEAIRAGLPTVSAFDLSWDSTPIEMMDESTDLVGTPSWLIRNSDDFVAKLVVASTKSRHTGEALRFTTDQFLDSLIDVAEGRANRQFVRLPSIFSSMTYLWRLCMQIPSLHPRREFVRALLLEWVRSTRRILQTEE